MDATGQTRRNPLRAAAISAGLVLTAAAIGNAATFANLKTWYAYLHKPAFTPPNWVFGPAWGTLYVLMAVAFWRILTLPDTARNKRFAVTSFLVQLALNASWSVVFFGMHSPAGALVVIALMIVAIVATLISFLRLDRPAALCLVPYLAWVCFATALNAGVWSLNR